MKNARVNSKLHVSQKSGVDYLSPQACSLQQSLCLRLARFSVIACPDIEDCQRQQSWSPGSGGEITGLVGYQDLIASCCREPKIDWIASFPRTW